MNNNATACWGNVARQHLSEQDPWPSSKLDRLLDGLQADRHAVIALLVLLLKLACCCRDRTPRWVWPPDKQRSCCEAIKCLATD